MGQYPKTCPKCGRNYTASKSNQVHCSRSCGSLPRPDEFGFWERVEIVDSGCWLWRGALAHGYGRIGRSCTHRLVYEYLVGKIPDGLELDHVMARGCLSTACCNPDHLEPVTHQVNIARSLPAQRAHCPQGHPYEGSNLVIDRGKRACRTCRRQRCADRARRWIADGLCGSCGKRALSHAWTCAVCRDYQNAHRAKSRARERPGSI